MAPETTLGIAAAGPFTQVLSSETTVSWAPTLDPFEKELPRGCDWVQFGNPGPIASEWERTADRWKMIDSDNAALQRLVPIDFVRSQIVSDASKDIVTGASGGWDVSVDALHAKVVTARFSADATIKSNGFALSVLVPRVGSLGWDDIASLRRLKALTRLREVLLEVEAEAFETAQSGGDLERAVQTSYRKKLADASAEIEGAGSIALFGLAELAVGAAVGYATMGLSLLGPVVGMAPGIAATGWELNKSIRGRRTHAWIGITEAISAAAN